MIGKAPVPVPTTSRWHFQGTSSSIESGVYPKAERNFFDGFLFRLLTCPRPNALIDEDHESLVLVTKKNGEATAGRSYGSDLHFDDGFTHTVRLYSPSRRDPNYCPLRQSISRLHLASQSRSLLQFFGIAFAGDSDFFQSGIDFA
jgi:hypothetical protein